MNVSRRMLPALAGALLSLSLLSYALMGTASAQAAGPATVTVRVVGSDDQTLLPLTQVTTNETPVVKDGNPADSCSGTSAAGALQLATEATKGSWSGPWEELGYSVETIDGVSYSFSQPPFYWDFWHDNKESSVGICDAELSTGDSLLFFVACYSETAGVCPPTPPNVLAIEAPGSVEVGKPVTVTVLSYPNEGGEPKPVEGVTVEGGGDANALPTNKQGQTTLTFSGDGKYTIDATGAREGPPTIPAEAFVCAHEGNDGTCGTTAPPEITGVTSKGTSTTTTVGGSSPAAVETAKIAGVKNNHVYSRHAAPRLLKGSVVVPAGGLLQKVQISLKRSYRGRCYGFNGSRVRFVAIKCKQAATFFSVGTKAAFSYLLPARLPAGRYTYEIEAVDGAGQATKLVSGVSHVVFQVK